MRKTVALVLILVLPGFLFLHTPALDACTTFCIESKGQLVFGRNYDWAIGVGLVIVNKKGLAKKAFISPPDRPAEWISKYGSITFNQYGKEMPMGGINEAGLVVEQMWLSESRYPNPDERPGLRELAWIQYQLDTSKSVDDVIASDSRIRITADSVPLHFLVCDQEGRIAAIEFLDGKMVVHKAGDLPFAALANSTYAKSMKYLKQFKGFGGELEMPKSQSSLDRFAGAAQGIRQHGIDQDEDIMEHAFNVLDDISQGPATQWSIVYDVRNLAIRFKTSKSPGIKTVELKDFDFSCFMSARILDIDTPKPGDAGKRFIDYSTRANRKLVFDAWKNTEFLKNTPDELLNQLAEYPESIKSAGENE